MSLWSENASSQNRSLSLQTHYKNKKVSVSCRGQAGSNPNRACPQQGTGTPKNKNKQNEKQKIYKSKLLVGCYHVKEKRAYNFDPSVSNHYKNKKVSVSCRGQAGSNPNRTCPRQGTGTPQNKNKQNEKSKKYKIKLLVGCNPGEQKQAHKTDLSVFKHYKNKKVPVSCRGQAGSNPNRACPPQQQGTGTTKNKNKQNKKCKKLKIKLLFGCYSNENKQLLKFDPSVSSLTVPDLLKITVIKCQSLTLSVERKETK